jgi:membrane protein
LSRTRRIGRGAGRVAADTVSGAIKAADEISGEASVFVRDAVIGVIEGTSRVAKVSRPVVREVASAAVISSTELSGNAPESVRQAVEGAIVGASRAGVSEGRASAQASEGVVEAVQNLGVDFTDIVSPAIHGVITGVLATSGNLFEATRETARALIKSGAESNQDAAEATGIIVGEAIRATQLYNVGTSDAVMGAARGCVEAAYDIDRPTGEHVRAALLALVDAPLNLLAPPIRRSVSRAISDLTEELRARPQFWRGVALWRAAKLLMRVGGIDSGAALAYYTLLAFFPLTALFVLGFSAFLDPDAVRRIATEVFTFYFPGAEQFLSHTIDHLYAQQLLASILSIGAIAIGALGLFVAANRGVNRLFGRPPKRLYGTTISTVAISSLAVILFLGSMGFTAVFQAVLRLYDRIPIVGSPITTVLLPIATIISALVPMFIAGIVFVVVLKRFPNQPIEWSDATFGGLVTVMLFEIAKYIFFFVNLFSQRDLLYGPISSVVLVLIWSHVAGMIFLYGAAITKQSSDLRPRILTIQAEESREARRQENIALGRSPWRDYDGGWSPTDTRWGD